MSKISGRGKWCDDGVVRYYDASKHRWVTQNEIERERQAQGIINFFTVAAAIIVGGGGFLLMVVETFVR